MDAQTKRTLSFFNSLHDNITDSMLAAFLQEVGLAKPGHSPSDLPQWHEWLPFKQALRNGPAVVSHTDELKRLKTFKSPVLLVKGIGSAPFLHKIIYRLCANLPDSRVIELAGGHAPHIASRDKFLSELEKLPENYWETSK